MALIIGVQDIVRKHDLLRKENVYGNTLTAQERKELDEINKYIKDINDELLDLDSKGIKIINGEIVNPKEEVKVIPKMTPAERREKGLAILAEMRERKCSDKEIAHKINLELGVSNTYGYKMVKEC